MNRGLAVCFALLMMVGQPGFSQTVDDKKTLSVSTKSTMELFPDQAKLSFEITADHFLAARALKNAKDNSKTFLDFITPLKSKYSFETVESGLMLSVNQPAYSMPQQNQTPGYIVKNEFTLLFPIKDPALHDELLTSITELVDLVSEEGYLPKNIQTHTPSGSMQTIITYSISDVDPFKEKLMMDSYSKNRPLAEERAKLIDSEISHIQHFHFSDSSLQFTQRGRHLNVFGAKPEVYFFETVLVSTTHNITYILK